MDFMTLAITLLSFSLSFLFALGGVGSALALIPMLTWLGVPFSLARPTALFVNTVSMLGATYSNIKARRLDYRLGLPIIASSIVLAPVGAWCGNLLPTQYVLVIFILFLLFSGLMILFFKGGKYANQYREDRPVLGPLFVGVLSGFLSGLLGVGGGGVIAPLMLLQGFKPKRVATITAFAVPFSSFSAFLTYVMLGDFSWKIQLFAGVAAWVGGYLGTIVMHRKMRSATVKKILGIVLLLLAARLILNLM